MNNQPILVFVHIPKTAGTTLRVIAEQQYPMGEILPLYGSDIGQACEVLRALKQSQVDHLAMIRGHFAYGVHEAINRPVRYITLLRRPVPRVLSLYNYILRSREHRMHDAVIRMGLVDFVSSGLSAETQNGMVFQLSGLHGELPQTPHTLYTKPDRHSLNVAIRNLRQFFALGVCEHFAAFVQFLNKHAGWRPVQIKNRNVSGRRYQPTLEETRVIREHNELDIELYNLVTGGSE